jgi:hypothetical protein
MKLGNSFIQVWIYEQFKSKQSKHLYGIMFTADAIFLINCVSRQLY